MSLLPHLKALLSLNTTLQEFSMSIEAIKAQVAEVTTSTANAIARVDADVANLKAKLAAGTVVSEADLNEISTGLSSIKAALDAVDPDKSFPPAA
jgi:chaperonin cofactor prefoldin